MDIPNAVHKTLNVGDPGFVNTTSFLLRATLGASVTLTCEVKNLGENSVLWMKTGSEKPPKVISMDKKQIYMKQRFRLEGDYFNKTFNLRIDNISRSDQGTYACQIATDPPLSSEVALHIHLPAEIIGQKQNDSGKLEWESEVKRFVYNESDMVNILCEVDGDPPAEVEWKRPDGTRVGEQSTPWLNIHRVQRQDSGTYICSASNTHEIVTQEVKIAVHYKPEIAVRNNDIRRKEGGYVTLECLVDAYPRPQYIWKKGRETISDINSNDVIRKSTSTRIPLSCYSDKTRLIIVSVDPVNDYGTYTCTAVNSVGNDTGVIEVSGRPREPRVLSPYQGFRMHSYTLRWDYGEVAPDNPSFIEVDQFVIKYRGMWYEEVGPDKVRVVYSNKEHLEKIFKPYYGDDQPRLPMSLELQSLRDNITYEVHIYGVNKYGIGNTNSFNFSTSDIDIEILTTPVPFPPGKQNGYSV
ncbi:protein amalgam-like isoform X2 [Amphiura filiformis]|uniref:protein amalgam-like isoform X2 n=1 Tax=Amphiura filiformis TaxID=82378 RepID=UPI003B21B7C5